MTCGPDARLPSVDPRPAVGSSTERYVILTVALASMLAPLNSTMIAVALPEIMVDFDVGVGSAGWLVAAYLVAMASLQPLGGKFGDRLGRRPMVIYGLVFFGLASLGASAAPTLWVTLLFRVLQAASGALIIPNGIALAREVVPETRRGRGYGLIGIAVGIAAASGPPLGGLLVETAGWRSIFYVNVLLVTPALLLGWKWLPAGRRTVHSGQFDVAGAVMLLLILIGTAGALMSVGGSAGLSSQIGIVLATLGLAAVFVRHELRHRDPVFEPRLFLNRAFAAAGGGVGLSNLAMYTLLLSVPILLDARPDVSAFETGLVLTALSASMIVLAPVGGLLADKFGRRAPSVTGLALATLGTAPIALAGADVGIPTLIGGLAVVGIGLGVANPGLQTTAVESVSRRRAGMAAGLYSTSRYLGSIVGSAILTGLLVTRGGDVAGLDTVFVIVFGAATLATAVALGLRARPSNESDE